MNKLSFRARALEPTKPLPVYKKDEISGKQDYTGHNRAVPQMPTGMEKEEESEHHLQRAISAQQVYGDKHAMVIPVPEAVISKDAYNNIYKENHRMPKTYVTNTVTGLHLLEPEKPEYDMDSEDEEFLKSLKDVHSFNVDGLDLERIIEQLEKSCGTQMVTLPEVQILFKEENRLLEIVFQYWERKRKGQNGPLLYQVRQERRDGSSNNDSYVAFRRRTEKMQTRKNRKNDETSYGKMVKLRREFCTVVTLFDMVKRRESQKKALIDTVLELFDKRVKFKDYDGKLIRQATKDANSQRIKNHVRAASNDRVFRRKRHSSGVVLANSSNNVEKVTTKPVSVTASSISRGQIESRDPTNKKAKKKRVPTAGPTTMLINALPSARNENIKRRNELHRPTTLVQTQTIRNKQSAAGSLLSSTQTSAVTEASSKNSANSSTTSSSNHHPHHRCEYLSSSTAASAAAAMRQYEYSDSGPEDLPTSNTIDEALSTTNTTEASPDGFFEFRSRTLPTKKYLKQLPEFDDWPWVKEMKTRYSLTTLTIPDRTIGFTRRRVGRGGRILFDRSDHHLSTKIRRLDLHPEYDHLPPTDDLCDLHNEIKNDRWTQYLASPVSRTSPPPPPTSTGKLKVEDKPQPPTLSSTITTTTTTTAAATETPANVETSRSGVEVKIETTQHPATTNVVVKQQVNQQQTPNNTAKYCRPTLKMMTSTNPTMATSKPKYPIINAAAQQIIGAVSSQANSTQQQQQQRSFKEQMHLVMPHYVSSSTSTVSSTFSKSCGGLMKNLVSNSIANNNSSGVGGGTTTMKVNQRTLNNGTTDHLLTKCISCGAVVTATQSAPHVNMATGQHNVKVTSHSALIGAITSATSSANFVSLPAQQLRASVLPGARSVVGGQKSSVVRISPLSNFSMHQQQQAIYGTNSAANVLNESNQQQQQQQRFSINPSSAASQLTQSQMTHQILSQRAANNVASSNQQPVSIKVNLQPASYRSNEDLMSGGNVVVTSSVARTIHEHQGGGGGSNVKIHQAQMHQQQQRGKAISFQHLNNLTSSQSSSQVVTSAVGGQQIMKTRKMYMPGNHQVFSVALTQANPSSVAVVSNRSNPSAMTTLTLDLRNNSNNVATTSLLANQLISGSQRTNSMKLDATGRLMSVTSSSANHGGGNHSNSISPNNNAGGNPAVIKSIVSAANKGGSNAASRKNSDSNAQQQQVQSTVKNSKSSRPMEVT